MEFNELIQAIGNGAFPVVMCVAFFVWFTKDYKSEQEKTREVMEELKDTVNSLRALAEIFGKKMSDKDE